MPAGKLMRNTKVIRLDAEESTGLRSEFATELAMRNEWLLLMVSAMVVSVAGHAIETEEERKAKQAELDAICEEARQKKIIPLRAQFVEECVEKEQRPDRASCERFYADYGERAGKRVPLFYDLPECVRAHEYRSSYRR